MDISIIYDIQFYNWVKAAFVASLRAIFGSNYVPPQYRFVDDEEETRILIYTAFPYRSFKTPCIVVDVDSGEADVSYIGPQEQVRRIMLDKFRIAFWKSPGPTDPVLLNSVPISYDDIASVEISGYTGYTLGRDASNYALILWGDPVPPEGRVIEAFVTLKNAKPYLYFTGILRLRVRIAIYCSTVTDVEKLTDLLIVFLRFFLRDKLAELKITYTKVSTSSISTHEWAGELLYKTDITISNCHMEYELVFPEDLSQYIRNITLLQTVRLDTEAKIDAVIKED